MTDHSNQLFVENALDDDNSAIRISSQTMEKLELFCGDVVKLKGKKRRETFGVVLSDDSCRDDRIRINNVIQNNLRVHSNDTISIQGSQSLVYGTRIHVLPIDDTVNGITKDMLKDHLQLYFCDSFRPVYVGDIFIVRTANNTIEFKVMATEPNPCCIVAPETIIDCNGEPLQRAIIEDLNNKIDFDDIGGLENVKKELKETVQNLMEYQQIYSKYNMSPSRGIFLYGPPGCGKTMLIKALANECDIKLISTNGLELRAMGLDKSEEYLHNIFDKAQQSAPCILFIDDIEYLFNIDELKSISADHLVDRLRCKLLAEIDCITCKTNILIVAATNQPDKICSSFFRPNRFDQMIYVPLPDETSRQAILKTMLQKIPEVTNVDVIFLARVSSGSSGGDIRGICHCAIKEAVLESIKTNPDIEEPKIEIRQHHFDQAIKPFTDRVVSDNNIHKYETFSQTRSNCNFTFQFPDDTQKRNAESNIYPDDDDLYG